ncbi:hypothetical protein TAF16_0863 [Anoxybacillus flavithermus]|uniref:Uncharacterized protein n=1 Tax=Anoxybacillus flavithermus TaxID=33934 RepID=A0A178TIN6_9BACL|nr:hypothetical protein TAF16_0863 [Anoxybacillus flavithermus]
MGKSKTNIFVKRGISPLFTIFFDQRGSDSPHLHDQHEQMSVLHE